jgi:heavy metal sensor kinase
MGERIDDVRNILDTQPPDATLAMLRKQFSEYSTRDDGKWLQILDQNGNWLFRSERIESVQSTLPLLQESPNRDRITQFKYATRHHFGRSGLALTHTISVHGRLYTVRTGFSESTAVALLQMFAADLVLLTPGLLLLAAFFGYWMSRAALKPITELAQRARQISGQSLDLRLPMSGTKDEVSHLSETLNQMLDRIESGVRSIREFTANAAHELRTPVALIRTEVEVAMSFPRSTGEYRESCANVQQETIRMAGLIDNLLLLARTDAGAEVLRFEVVDAVQLTRRVGEKWSASMRQALLEFHPEYSDAPLQVRCHVLSMQRLLNILLDNACRYTPPGGSIRLRVSEENESVLLEVSDTGIGIDAKHLPHIFGRFYRVDQPRSRQADGSGLGLALAKWIADQHGAALTVESQVGVGTRFCLAMDQQARGKGGAKLAQCGGVKVGR